MFVKDELAFDPSDPAFLEDPYPVLNRLREAAPVFYDERLERWFVTRHEDVRACLRDKRLGRNFRHVLSPAEIGAPELDPRWEAFWATERWSLLWLEPPEHTRIRKLVAAAFTPRSVEALRAPSALLARELLPEGELDLLRDYAQPYSIAVICRLLGVPTDRARVAASACASLVSSSYIFTIACDQSSRSRARPSSGSTSSRLPRSGDESRRTISSHGSSRRRSTGDT